MIDKLPRALIQHILETVGIGIVLLEPVGEPAVRFKLRYHNRGASTMLKELRQASFEQLLDSEGLLARALQALAQQSPLTFEHLVIVQGVEHWYRFELSPFEGLLLMMISDITRQKQYEIHIRNLAFSDDLTGIYNRRYFRARAPGLIALAQREGWAVALIFFDLNGFKAVNDAYGHSTGDKLLQAVAWRLSQICRSGEIFFRSGGDEFALFLPKATPESAQQTAERIAKHFAFPFEVAQQLFDIGASIGIAVIDGRQATVDLLLEQADTAMYRAKEQKNQQKVTICQWGV